MAPISQSDLQPLVHRRDLQPMTGRFAAGGGAGGMGAKGEEADEKQTHETDAGAKGEGSGPRP